MEEGDECKAEDKSSGQNEQNKKNGGMNSLPVNVAGLCDLQDECIIAVYILEEGIPGDQVIGDGFIIPRSFLCMISDRICKAGRECWIGQGSEGDIGLCQYFKP